VRSSEYKGTATVFRLSVQAGRVIVYSRRA